MKKYSDKLKDPRWQKKRLEVLNRDKFRCCSCGDTEKTLHVHHRDYLSNTEPWDYPIEYFQTLCENCHNDMTIERPDLEKAIIREMRLKLLDVFLYRITLQVFEDYNLNNLILLLWDLGKDKVEPALIKLLKDLEKEKKKSKEATH